MRFFGVRMSLVLTVLGGVLASHAEAAGAIRIKVIDFDPPGRDAESLNEEFVVIKNLGERSRSLRGWTLHDQHRQHYYRFIDVRLRPGDRLKLHTGTGADRGVHRYWDKRVPVWDNNGDRAVLRRSDGTIVDVCRYGERSFRRKAC